MNALKRDGIERTVQTIAHKNQNQFKLLKKSKTSKASSLLMQKQ